MSALIDLRSDTVTRPSPGMRQAIAIGVAMIDWAKRARLTAPVERTLGLDNFHGDYSIVENNPETTSSAF